MVQLIALTQGVFVALGTMAMIVLVKAEPGGAGHAHAVREFLAAWGLWFLAIPGAWFCAALITTRRAPATAGAVNASGILLAAVLLLGYGFLVLFA